nr:uncharacterized protein LOC104651141 [Saimiri boliviensis boliviensis]
MAGGRTPNKAPGSGLGGTPVVPPSVGWTGAWFAGSRAATRLPAGGIRQPPASPAQVLDGIKRKSVFLILKSMTEPNASFSDRKVLRCILLNTGSSSRHPHYSLLSHQKGRAKNKYSLGRTFETLLKLERQSAVSSSSDVLPPSVSTLPKMMYTQRLDEDTLVRLNVKPLALSLLAPFF